MMWDPFWLSATFGARETIVADNLPSSSFIGWLLGAREPPHPRRLSSPHSGLGSHISGPPRYNRVNPVEYLKLWRGKVASVSLSANYKTAPYLRVQDICSCFDFAKSFMLEVKSVLTSTQYSIHLPLLGKLFRDKSKN